MHNKIYDKLNEKLPQLEEQRIQILNENKKTTKYTIVFFIIFALPFISVLFGDVFGFLFIFCIPQLIFGSIITLWYFIYNSALRRKKYNVKDPIISEILSAINPTFKYSSRAALTNNTLKDYGFFDYSNMDKILSEDKLTGIWNSHEFEFCEATLQTEHTDSNGHTHYNTIFKGQIYKIEFNKQFKSPLYIRTKKSFKGFKFKSIPAIELEDVEFNKNFLVYGYDEIESRYILSPTFMSRLNTLKEKYNCKILEVSFENNHISMMISNNTNLFEINLKESFYERKFIDPIIKDLMIIDEICNLLELDRENRSSYIE